MPLRGAFQSVDASVGSRMLVIAVRVDFDCTAHVDSWTDEKQMDSPWKKSFIIHARKNLLPVRDRLIFFKDEQEFLPGITAISAPGHTVGQTMFNVQSNGQSLIFVGDISHHSVLLIENPRMELP